MWNHHWGSYLRTLSTWHVQLSFGALPSIQTETLKNPSSRLGSWLEHTNYKNMYKPAVSDTCPLCGEGTEDRQHCLVVCKSLTTAREPYLSHIRRMMDIYTNELCQTLIDCTHTSLSDIVQLCDTNQLETLARDLIFSIHVRRGQIWQHTIQWNKGDRELHNLNLSYRLWRHRAEN